MAKFWLKSSRYFKQKGQERPQYVAASASRPVLVELPDDYVIGKSDKLLLPFSEKPAKLAPAYANTPTVKVRKSHEPKDSGESQG